MRSIQFVAGHGWFVWRRFKHVKGLVYSVTKLFRRSLATAQATGTEEFHLNVVGSRHKASARKFDLDYAVHSSESRYPIEIDHRGCVGSIERWWIGGRVG